MYNTSDSSPGKMSQSALCGGTTFDVDKRRRGIPDKSLIANFASSNQQERAHNTTPFVWILRQVGFEFVQVSRNLCSFSMAQRFDPNDIGDLSAKPHQLRDIYFLPRPFRKQSRVQGSFQSSWLAKWKWLHYVAKDVRCFTCCKAMKDGRARMTGKAEADSRKSSKGIVLHSLVKNTPCTSGIPC